MSLQARRLPMRSCTGEEIRGQPVDLRGPLALEKEGTAALLKLAQGPAGVIVSRERRQNDLAALT
jgi:hypothetical protein